ncbi:MAG: type II toxin-antitoxin system RatA family toxin [Pseudomonadota bacterium]
MPKFETRHQVGYSASQMFDLVADVEKYPEFLPLCEGLTVRSRREKGGVEMLTADMSVGYKKIRETFTSRVLLKRAENRIDVSYLDGPFRYLENLWSFEDNEDGCTISFFIDYEFKSRALGLLMGAMFDRAFKHFVDAFEKRAAEIYDPLAVG